MAFLKRLSDNLWSYVSPSKSPAPAKSGKTPATAPPKFKNPARAPRRGSIEDIVRQSRSMSPGERVDSWRDGVSSRTPSSFAEVGKKRKATGFGAGRPAKSARMEYDSDEGMEDQDVEMEDEEMEDYEEGDEEEVYDEQDGDEEQPYDEDEVEYDDEDEDGGEEDDLDNLMSGIRIRNKSPGSASSKGVFYDEDEHDDTLIVDDAENFASPHRRKLANLPEEASNKGVSTEELREAGWDDDHITLVQKLTLRGFEPLLPDYYRMDFRYMPDTLFAESDDAFITAIKGPQYHGVKAIEKLFEMGGRMRDRFIDISRVTAEQQAVRSVKDYIKWSDRDADFDLKTSIPVLAFEAKPANTDVELLQDNIRLKMARLHARWTTAFSAQHSIETTPSSTGTRLHYPVPQIYGLLASHTLVAVVAYRKGDPENEVRTVAYFDFKDKDYDVWNALAMAIVVCHVRNVRCRIAEEAGVGLKGPDWKADYESDPDL